MLIVNKYCLQCWPRGGVNWRIVKLNPFTMKPLLNCRTLMTMMLLSGIFFLNDAFGQATDTSASCTSGADVGSTDCSFASGQDATVSSDNATAVSGAEASGEGSFAAGPFSVASGSSASALSGGSASGGSSVAIGSGSATNTNSVSIGSGGSATGIKAINIGQSTVTGEFGYSIGKENNVGGECTWTFGEYLRTSSSASHNMVIGHGNFQSTQLLENDISNSIMIGVNSSEPTMYFEDAGGGAGIGRVGVGTTDPDGLLHLLDESNTDTDLIIENQSNQSGRIFFREGNTNRSNIICNASDNLVVENAVDEGDIEFHVTDASSNTNPIMWVSGENQAVGIGVANPGSLLHVRSEDNDIARFSDNDAPAANSFRITNLSSGNSAEFAAGMQARSNVNDVPALQFMALVEDSLDSGTEPMINFLARQVDGDTIDNRPLFQWQNDSDTKMLMDANGNLGIGTTAPTAMLTIGADDACKPNTPTWQICSDANLKTDVSDFEDGLEVLTQINPVWFRYNGIGYMPTEDLSVGIIAQEVQQVAPYMIEATDIVVDTASMETMSVLKYNANPLFYLLVNSVQELDQRTSTVAEMEAELEVVSSSYSHLQQQFNELSERVEQCCSASESSNKRGGEDSSELNLGESEISVAPNPFSESTTISYSLKNNETNVQLIISDSGGQLVYSVPVAGDSGSLTITSADLQIGTYYCSLVSDGVNISTIRVVHIR